MGELSACHRRLEIQVDIQARELYSEFFILMLGPYKKYLDMETWFILRISIQILWALWFGLGSHFEKIARFDIVSKVTMFIFSRNMFQTCFFSKRPRPQGAFRYGLYRPYMNFLPGHQNGAFFSISRFPGHQRGSIFSISRIPGRQNGSFFSIYRFPGHQNA